MLVAAPASASAASEVVVDVATDGTGSGSECELRDAIVVLNTFGTPKDGCTATPIAGSLDLISFDIGASGSQHTIALTSQLNMPTSPSELDGRNGGSLPAIGLDASGLASGNGIVLSSGADGSRVHDLAIYGAPSWGVLVDAPGTTLQRLLVGTDLAGSSGIGNGADGVNIRADGVTVADSVISGNGQSGIDFSNLFDPSADGSGATIVGNTIGMNPAGTAPLPNAAHGIQATLGTGLGPADGVTIGGSDPIGSGCGVLALNDCNLIAGNAADQVHLTVGGSGGARADGWRISGNYIGTTADGSAAADSTPVGVGCSSSPLGIEVGGSFADLEIAGNLVSGVRGRGIGLSAAPGASSDTGPVRTAIDGNRIGTDAGGTAAVPNQCEGVSIAATIMAGDGIFDPIPNTVIGGTADPTPGGACDGDCNLISGNGTSGVAIVGHVTGTRVRGNYIGTGVSGLAALPNASYGITVSGSHFDSGETLGTIGSAGAGNVIAANGASGVTVNPNSSFPPGPLTIASNRIGVGANGSTALGNGDDGVTLGGQGTTGVTIGGTAASAANTIAANGGDGVELQGGVEPAHGNPILRNSIYSNGDLGIDLMPDGLTSGVTANGSCLTGVGANDCQRFPTLTAAAGGGAAAMGTLVGAPSTDYRIELYANTTKDASGNGEGRRFVAATDVRTGPAGNVGWIFGSKSATINDGEFISATATRLSGAGAPGSTSEFAADVHAPTCSLTGGPGPNVLTGGSGSQVICGNDGADTLTGGSGADAILGGAGNDTIHADDGEADPLVDCGAGTDTVYSDASDVLSGCESVNPVSPPPPPPPPPPPADTDPPKLKLSGSQKQKSKKKVIVKAKCKDEECDLKATGTIKIKGRSFDLKKAKKSGVGAGEKKKLKLKLRKEAKRKLGKVIKRKKSKAKVKVTATDAAGNSAKDKFKVKVKR